MHTPQQQQLEPRQRKDSHRSPLEGVTPSPAAAYGHQPMVVPASGTLQGKHVLAVKEFTREQVSEIGDSGRERSRVHSALDK